MCGVWQPQILFDVRVVDTDAPFYQGSGCFMYC